MKCGANGNQNSGLVIWVSIFFGPEWRVDNWLLSNQNTNEEDNFV